MFDELNYAEVIQRLDNLNKIDIDERLTNIEKQLKYFIMICTDMSRYFQSGVKIKVDETAMGLINPIKETLELLRKESNEFQVIRKNLQSDGVFGTLQYMAKQITELTKHIASIKEDGISKKIKLDLTMDGYEMVKKKAEAKEDDTPPQLEVDPIKCVKDLLKTLTERESQVIIHRYGFFGEKEKSLVDTGRVMKISGERVRGLQTKALRKMKHASRRELVQRLTHLDLKIDIQNQE